MEVVPSKFEENLDKSMFDHPSDYVKENSLEKAIDVFISQKSQVELQFCFAFKWTSC